MSASLNFNLSQISQSEFSYKLIDQTHSEPFHHFEIEEDQIEKDLKALDQMIKDTQSQPSLSDTVTKTIDTVDKINFQRKSFKSGKSFRKRPTVEENEEEEINPPSVQSIQKRKQGMVVSSKPVTSRPSHFETSSANESEQQKMSFLSKTTLEETVSHSKDEVDILLNTTTTLLTKTDSLITEFKGEDLVNLRFTQRTIQAQLGDEEGTYLFQNPYDSTIPSLFDLLRKQGWKQGDKHKITAILMPDGHYSSFDNRRLAVAKTINELISHSITVHAQTYLHSDNAPSFFMSRLGQFRSLPSPIEGIKAHTYGHAVVVRVAESSKKQLNSSEKYGFKDYPGVVTGLRGRNVKRILVNSTNKTVSLS